MHLEQSWNWKWPSNAGCRHRTEPQNHLEPSFEAGSDHSQRESKREGSKYAAKTGRLWDLLQSSGENLMILSQVESNGALMLRIFKQTVFHNWLILTEQSCLEDFVINMQ